MSVKYLALDKEGVSLTVLTTSHSGQYFYFNMEDLQLKPDEVRGFWGGWHSTKLPWTDSRSCVRTLN